MSKGDGEEKNRSYKEMVVSYTPYSQGGIDELLILLIHNSFEALMIHMDQYNYYISLWMF
jgi:hypothetical protein